MRMPKEIRLTNDRDIFIYVVCMKLSVN